MRRLLRTWLLRLAAWLDDAPARVSSSGPPPHWLERVRRAQFVSSDDAPAPLPVTREVPRVGVPRVVARDPLPVARTSAPAILTPVSSHVPHPAVDVNIAKPRSAERIAEPDSERRFERNTEPSSERRPERIPDRSAGFQPAGPPASSRPVIASLGGQRPAGRPTGASPAGAPAIRPPGRRPPESSTSHKNTWPELESGPAGSRRTGRLEAGAPMQLGGRRASETVDNEIANHWPELPDADDNVIASFDDSEHLRRIDAEQRGAAWSE